MSENQRIIQLQELLREQPNDAFMNYALALEYIKLENIAMAEKQFRFLVREHPSYVGTYYHYAKLMAESEKYSEAMSIYEDGIKQAKEIKDTHSQSELESAFMNLKIELDEI